MVLPGFLFVIKSLTTPRPQALWVEKKRSKSCSKEESICLVKMGRNSPKQIADNQKKQSLIIVLCFFKWRKELYLPAQEDTNREQDNGADSIPRIDVTR